MTLLVLLLLKSLLVFALSGVVLLCLRRASASARHLVCLLTLSALLALPLFSLTLPAWRLAGLSSTDSLSVNNNVGAPLTAPSVPPAASSAAPDPGNLTAKNERREAASQEGAASGVPTLLLTETKVNFWPLACLALYLLGIVLAGLRPLLGLWGITHLRRACVPVTDTPALGMSADCAAALRLTCLPLLCRADVPVPMTWGWRRPVVLLPLGSDAWPQDRLRSVLLHEMAHVKRRDWPGHRLADLACAVYWFHPLVWLTARRLRAESEIACDDLVLASGIPAADYARHLLDIARALPPASRPPHSAAIAMAQTSHIKRRITMILDKTQSRRTVTRRALLIALIPSAAALLTLAALRPAVKAQATPSVGAASSTATLPAATSSHSALHFLWPPGGSFVRIFSEPHGGTTTTMLASPDLMTTTDLTINGTTLFAGMTEANNPGSSWWSASGARLPSPVYDTNLTPSNFRGVTGTHFLSFAFRLPAKAQDITTKYNLPDSGFSSSDGGWPTKLQENVGRTEGQIFASTGGARVVTASFAPSRKKTDLQIGIASGPWKTAATEIRSFGTVEAFEEIGTTLAGNQSFILGQPVQAAKEVTLTVSDDSVDDIRVVAVDTQGNTLFPVTVGSQSISNLDQIMVHFSQPLSQIKEFRVETRPFQWIEFKDVALQPIK